jgi:hypothetical protein
VESRICPMYGIYRPNRLLVRDLFFDDLGVLEDDVDGEVKENDDAEVAGAPNAPVEGAGVPKNPPVVGAGAGFPPKPNAGAGEVDDEPKPNDVPDAGRF